MPRVCPLIRATIGLLLAIAGHAITIKDVLDMGDANPATLIEQLSIV